MQVASVVARGHAVGHRVVLTVHPRVQSERRVLQLRQLAHHLQGVAIVDAQVAAERARHQLVLPGKVPEVRHPRLAAAQRAHVRQVLAAPEPEHPPPGTGLGERRRVAIERVR